MIIAEAAEAWRAGGPIVVQIVGFTDFLGSLKYRVALAERRVAAVKQALIESGVHPASIRTYIAEYAEEPDSAGKYPPPEAPKPGEILICTPGLSA